MTSFPRTPSMRTSGAAAGAAAGLALAACAFAPVAFAACVFVVIALLVAWGWPRLLDLPSPRGTSGVLAGTALALVGTMLASESGDRSRWAGAVICVGLIASFLHQLLRQDGRPRLVTTLAGTALGLGVLGAGSYVLAAVDAHDSHRLLVAAGLAAAAGCVLDGVAGETSRRFELGVGQCILGGLAGAVAVTAGAKAEAAIAVGAVSGLLSWATLRTTVTSATSAHTRAHLAAGGACVLVCAIVPVAVAHLLHAA